MKNNFKRIAAGLCALTMITCLSEYAENASSIMSAKAGSSFSVNVNDENNDIKFDESQISQIEKNIKITEIPVATAKNVKISTSNNVITGTFSGLEFINKISFTIQATNTSLDYLKENVRIFAESYISKDGKEYSDSESEKVWQCKKEDSNIYTLDFYTGIKGDSYSFKISGLNNVDNLSVLSHTIENEAVYKVEATYLDGEGICAYLPASEGLNKDNMTKWAKNQCLLANSLKHLTNNPGYYTVYYYFNGSVAYADAQTNTWGNSDIRSGKIRFNPDATKQELELIKLNENAFNYFTMHEMGHVYNGHTNFDEKIIFRSGNSSFDEYYTNVRALTALQNCENIRSYKVRKENNYTSKRELFSYKDVYKVNYNYKSGNDYEYHFANSLLKCCDWEKLETFYSAEFVPDRYLSEWEESAKKLYDSLSNVTGIDFSDRIVDNSEYSLCKFVNGLRCLYSLSTNMEYDDEKFIDFVDKTFTIKKNPSIGINNDISGLEFIRAILIKHEVLRSDIVITNQPSNVQVGYGKPVRTSVTALGDELSYQWYVKNPGDKGFSKSSITKAVYETSMRKEMDGREIYCEITDKYGTSVRSDTVTLGTVIITEQPSHTYAPLDGTVKTSVTALGDNLSYQWYVKNPGDKGFSKSSITKAVYETSMREEMDGREIYCVITDEKTKKSVKSDTVILATLAITKQPTNVQTPQKTFATTSVAAIGDGLSYQWYRISSPTEIYCIPCSEPELQRYNVWNGSQVFCRVTDKNGKYIDSDIVTLGPVIITEQPTNVQAKVGEQAKTKVSAIGEGKLTYEWWYCEPGTDVFYKSSRITGDTYDCEMTEAKNGRKIYCVVKDENENSTFSNIVTIGLPLEITEDLVDVTAKLGEKVEFSVSAKGYGLTYKWYFKNKNMKNFEVTETFKTNKYGFDQMTLARADREVYCVITDIFGNERTTATIKIGFPAGYGDANCDSVVDAKDADAILKAYANSDKNALTPQGEKNADVSGDGGVTPDDALLIQQYLSN